MSCRNPVICGRSPPPMRLILSGIFDKLPELKIIIGHWGETLPYFLRRSLQSSPAGTSCGFPKSTPQKRSQATFGGTGALFLGVCDSSTPVIAMVSSYAHFPKSANWEYHHVVGQCDLFCLRQTVLSSLPYESNAPHSMVILFH